MKVDVFDPIELEWAGVAYTIPPNRVMGALHRVERHITLPEIVAYRERGGAPAAIISSAFADVLRYAGSPVTSEEVYDGMFADANNIAATMASLEVLLSMMLPKSFKNRAAEAEKTDMGKSAPEMSSSSKKPSSGLSGLPKSRRKNSGNFTPKNSG